jgi:hypothetical protein
MGKASFKNVVKNGLCSSHFLVYVTIPIVKDLVDQVAFYNTNGHVCYFSSLWPCLVDLHKWILDSWTPELKEEVFIYPYTKGFFIVKFDLRKDRYLILRSSPWLWGSSGSCMKPWLHPLTH